MPFLLQTRFCSGKQKPAAGRPPAPHPGHRQVTRSPPVNEALRKQQTKPSHIQHQTVNVKIWVWTIAWQGFSWQAPRWQDVHYGPSHDNRCHLHTWDLHRVCDEDPAERLCPWAIHSHRGVKSWEACGVSVYIKSRKLPLIFHSCIPKPLKKNSKMETSLRMSKKWLKMALRCERMAKCTAAVKLQLRYASVTFQSVLVGPR